MNVTCSGTPGSVLTCGFLFGSSDFQVDVNGNPRYFRHFVDVGSLIPEPGTALLFGTGLSLLCIRRQATRSAEGLAGTN